MSDRQPSAYEIARQRLTNLAQNRKTPEAVSTDLFLVLVAAEKCEWAESEVSRLTAEAQWIHRKLKGERDTARFEAAAMRACLEAGRRFLECDTPLNRDEFLKLHFACRDSTAAASLQADELVAARTELAAARSARDSMQRSTERAAEIVAEAVIQKDAARCEAAAMREALNIRAIITSFRPPLLVCPVCYCQSDGHYDYCWLGNALKLPCTAAASLQAELVGLREQRDADPMAYAVHCKAGSEFDYRLFADKADAKDFVVEHWNEEEDDPVCEVEIIELVPRLRKRVKTPSAAEFEEMAKHSEVPPELRGIQETAGAETR